MPEAYGANRSLVPTDTFVVVGYYRSSEHLTWIEREGLYNARTGDRKEALHLGVKEAGAKYLLLHSHNELISSKLYKLSEQGPTIFSREDLIKKGYPTTPTRPYYLVYQLEGNSEAEFEGAQWDLRKLSSYQPFRKSSFPFACSLAELMSVMVKK